MNQGNHALYFKNQWFTPQDIDPEFVAHAMHFGRGITGELRSYSYNGGPHIFKASNYFDDLKKQAQEKHFSIPHSTDSLVRISYELLHRNHLTNARLTTIFYKIGNEVHLMISGEKANPFTVRENVNMDLEHALQQDHLSFSEENPLFFFKEGILYTPKVAGQASPGIIRSTIIECALALGYPVIEKSITVDELENAETVFFSSSTHEINFIQQYQDYSFTKDWRETMAMDLLMMFRQQATNEEVWNYSII